MRSYADAAVQWFRLRHDAPEQFDATFDTAIVIALHASPLEHLCDLSQEWHRLPLYDGPVAAMAVRTLIGALRRQWCVPG